jgi:hypothetical protein
MSGRKPASWSRLAIVAASVALALVLAGGGTLADAGCKKVSGKFTLQPVTGPACTSSVGVCATGVYRGDLAGTSSFVGSSLVPTVDTPTTGVILLTGDSDFTLAGGTLLTKDAIVLRTTGAGDFAEVDTIVGGTGAWAGTTGQFSATGTFTAASGGEGVYSGEVCTP